MNAVTLESPAKINLMLSVHGRREDGFHALTSLVVALDFGDSLQVGLQAAGGDRLRCSDATVPTGEANLVIQAAQAFRAALGEEVYFDFQLEKRIPMGAGLGGGSSNAVAALRAMNQLTGEQLNRATLLDLAAGLGSDCPFFVDAVPAVMKGRGEVLEALPAQAVERLHGQEILLFRPNFGVNTAWAYRRLIEAQPSAYESEARAAQRLQSLDAEPLDKLLYNTFEESVGGKYLAIACLLDELRSADVACLMSGSGSCCFALTHSEAESSKIRDICEKAWGPSIFFVETLIL
jgi:4-diphosphocytidyl-2-C-methyl-D-erythritol kinase